MKYAHKRLSSEKLTVIAQANVIIDDFRARGYQLTLRQLYYQFVSKDWIPNSDRSYKRLGDCVADGRMAGLIDWSAITDRLRKQRDLTHWSNPREIIKACASQFRIEKWRTQPKRVEVWVEKDALSDVVAKACEPLDVPYFVCRGYTSVSAMWESGNGRVREWQANGQQPVILHLGDHDPSGIDMSRDIAERLEMFAQAPIEFHRIALNMDQVDEYSPPPNPAKLSDARAEHYISQYGPSSWELDALDPDMLRKLITDHVLVHRDDVLWQTAKRKEAEMRSALGTIADNWRDVAGYAIVKHTDGEVDVDVLDPPQHHSTRAVVYECPLCQLAYTNIQERDDCKASCEAEASDDP